MDLTELKGLPLIKAKPVNIDFELTDENIENYRETFDDESVVIVHVDDTAYSIIGGDLCDVLYEVRDDILAEEEYDDYSITYYVDVETKNFDGDKLNLLAAAAEAYGSVDNRIADDEEKSVVCFDGDVCFVMENNCYDEEISQADFDKLWVE